MADEARAMLDALMGGDRNAPLPSGTATKRARDGQVVLPSKKRKSCYDYDICPLYCAWNGVDVYELFVNTKSDIGPNPKTPSDSAMEEFQSLPKHEQERLGFHHLLFVKLQDLVRMCDRTVARNKEKIIQEKRGKGTANIDYVTTVDERAVEDVCRTQLDLDKVVKDLEAKEKELEQVMKQEAELQERYEKEKEQVANKEGDKKEDGGEQDAEQEEAKDESKDVADPRADVMESGNGNDEATDETVAKDESSQNGETNAESNDAKEQDTAEKEDSPLKQEMRELLLKRQRLLFDLARTIQQHAPIQQALDSQLEQLHYVKSDITSDKTVCEVSGNFMSARDADERIAAHYAGKQYVGWKLVRDKLKEMVQEYGRYGPKPGEGARRGGGGRGGGGDSRYGRDSGRPGDRNRYGGRSDGRWERGGRGGGAGGYRDYGGDRGGGYNSRGGYGGGGGRGRDHGRWRR